MALSVPGPKTEFDRMAQRYRTRQASMAARSALTVGRYWKGVEVGNEQSEANFVELSVKVLASGFMETAEDSREFVLETLNVEPDMVMPVLEQMSRSMAYVGPIQARKAMRAGEGFDTEFTPADARSHVEKQVRGAAVRLSALGGREVVRSTIDGKRVGYARVTGWDPCYFCAMLAGRRAVYDEDSFEESDARFVGWGRVKVHDSCQCSLIPVTAYTQDQLTQMDYFEKLWKDLSGKGRKSTDSSPLVTFRRNYDELRAA